MDTHLDDFEVKLNEVLRPRTAEERRRRVLALITEKMKLEDQAEVSLLNQLQTLLDQAETIQRHVWQRMPALGHTTYDANGQPIGTLVDNADRLVRSLRWEVGELEKRRSQS